MSNRSPRPDRAKRRGFALIITITLLSFLVLLLVSLASMTRVETQVASNSRELAQARQNALYGLQIAIGQLQKYAGADQRITAPATTIFPSDVATNLNKFKNVTNGTGELYNGGTTFGATNGYRNFANTAQGRSYLGANARTYLTHTERASWNTAIQTFWNNGRNPHYVGVLDASLRVDRTQNPTANPIALPPQPYETSATTKFGEPKRDQIPIWLVSGVEKYTIDQQNNTVVDSSGSNKAAEYFSNFSPTATLPTPSATNNTIYLVDYKSASSAADSTSGLDGRVKVLKQQIQATDGSVLGNYAYWVGDESLKANFSVRDPFASATPGTVDYRNRLQVPQRLGWERITGFSALSFNPNDPNDPLYPVFSQIVSTAQIPFLSPTLADNPSGPRGALPRNFHDLTGVSRSLLTDTALGGLKKDLTVYLSTGTGLNSSDPIADRSLYNTNDTRFRAWGAVNNGFPVSAPPYVNTGLAGGQPFPTIPTWGQIRSWYTNQSSGGSSITATTDTAPIVTYIMFHAGWSYSSGVIRWHWLPCIALWNPYDVGLNSATYNLDIGISPVIWQGFVAKDNPTLAELQKDVDADWREVKVPAGSDYTAPDGNKVLNRDGTVYTNGGSGEATIQIFKGTRTGISGTRYFTKFTPETGKTPDSYDMRDGPWTYEAPASGSNPGGVADGTTDLFGRFYYWVENARPSDSVLQKNSAVNGADRSVLGTKSFAIRYAPHNTTTGTQTFPLPRPLTFTITDSFLPGETKIYTMGSTQQWSGSTAVNLSNAFESTYPHSLYFDAFNVTNGPSSASGQNIKFVFNQLAQNVAAPTLHFKLGTQTIMRSDTPLGDITFNGMIAAVVGNKFADFSGYSTNGGANADSDSPATVNRDEPPPKFLDKWRPLYDFSEFRTKALAQDTQNTDSSIFPYGATWIQPLTSDGGTSGTNLTDRLPVFSRFNLGAKIFDAHPLVDARRDRYHSNNTWGSGAPTRLEGFSRLYYVENDESTNQKWDNDQYSGATSPRGFSLIVPKSLATVGTGAAATSYLGQSLLQIRNARRANSEILSLGQLQQINLSSYFWEPAYPIGNSWAPPYTDREAIAGLNSRFIGGKPATLVGKVPADQFNQTLDLSYLLNENLWDRYFLSSIPQTGPFNAATPLANSRHVFNQELSPTASTVRNINDASGYLYNVGALNVNTTSVEAWRALLSAFRGLALKPTPSSPASEATNVPVARTLDPVGGAIQFTTTTQNSADIGSTPNNKNYSTVLGGFRYLTDAMISNLAERIVDEVRLRGPFLSVSDFVNRRLVAPQGSNQIGGDGTIANGASAWYDARTNGYVGAEGAVATSGTASSYPPQRAGDQHPDYIAPSYDPFVGLQGLSGALQRAIQVSGINGGINHPSPTANDRVFGVRIKNSGGADYNGGSGLYTTSATLATNTSQMHTQDPTMRSHLDSEHIAGAPAGEAGQLFDGSPGFLSQGDLLAMIGPALTARGDTFIIRTYGDAINPATGDLQGRAWLEAVVQRTVEPVTASSSDRFKPTDSFGRKFKIVSFRWLDESDL